MTYHIYYHGILNSIKNTSSVILTSMKINYKETGLALGSILSANSLLSIYSIAQQNFYAAAIFQCYFILLDITYLLNWAFTHSFICERLYTPTGISVKLHSR